MRITAFLLLCFAPPLVLAADLSPYSGPCEATLSAEAKFVEEGFSTVREKWRTKVRVSVQLDAGAGPTKLAESQRILCIELAVASACVQSMAGAHRVAQSLIPAHSRASDRFAKE